MQVVTLKDHTYGQKKRRTGEKYEADPRFIKLLVSAGFVRVTTEPEPETAKPVGRYNRRDMRAKD